MEGPFGFYEAVDYTPARLPRGQTSAIVRSFMAHHQGMNLVALSHALLGRPMQRRFEADPSFQATLMLLQERIPKTSAVHTHVAQHAEGSAFSNPPDASAHAPIGADSPTPEVQLLSNGRLHVMVTNAGGGYCRWRDLAITRWREDTTATTGDRSSICATWPAESTGPPRTSRRSGGRTATRPCSPRGAPSTGAATSTTRPTPRSSFRRKTTSNCAGCASPTMRTCGGRSRSRATPRWCWRRRPRTRCSRRSATCSCRRKSSRPGARSCARGGRDRPPSRRPGCST